MYSPPSRCTFRSTFINLFRTFSLVIIFLDIGQVQCNLGQAKIFCQCRPLTNQFYIQSWVIMLLIGNRQKRKDMACFFFLSLLRKQKWPSGSFCNVYKRPGDIHLSVFLFPVAELCCRKCARETKAPFTLRDVPSMEIESFSPELLRAMDGQRIRAEERRNRVRMEKGRTL